MHGLLYGSDVRNTELAEGRQYRRCIALLPHTTHYLPQKAMLETVVKELRSPVEYSVLFTSDVDVTGSLLNVATCWEWEGTTHL